MCSCFRPNGIRTIDIRGAGKDACFCPGGGGGTPTYRLYRYVPRGRVWFLRFSVLK